MPAIYLLPYIVQLGLIYHVMKTGRDQRWMYILIMLPMAGGLLYFFVEILPELLGSRQGRTIKTQLINKVDPDKDYRKAKRAYEDHESTHTMQEFAQAALESGRAAEAEKLFRSAMTGINQDDPVLRFGLAQSLGALGRFAEARDIALMMRRDSPDFRRWRVSWLLGAAAIELGDPPEGEAHLRDTLPFATEEGPRMALAALLKSQGRMREANDIYKDVVARARKSPPEYVSANKAHINAAKEAIKDLT